MASRRRLEADVEKRRMVIVEGALVHVAMCIVMMTAALMAKDIMMEDSGHHDWGHLVCVCVRM